ncbi:unnamed protein product, partial [Brenthis ino]
MAAKERCCVPSCGSQNHILHKFPHPEKESDRFRTWLCAVGGDLLSLDNNYIHKYRSVCHLHFESSYYTWSKRLAHNAIPTFHLPVYILLFDEMSLKKHLHYNPKEDLIEDYQDHGCQERSANIAAYALVFMIAGIKKKEKQPITHYFSSAFSTADRLAVLIKEVLNECFNAGINVTATVCDMDGVNRRAMQGKGKRRWTIQARTLFMRQP